MFLVGFDKILKFSQLLFAMKVNHCNFNIQG
jgi:hypothetical protein